MRNKKQNQKRPERPRPSGRDIARVALRLGLGLGLGGAVILGGGAAVINHLLAVDQVWWKGVLSGGFLGLGVALLLVAFGVRHAQNELYRLLLGTLGGAFWGAAVTLVLFSLSDTLIGANIGAMIGVLWAGKRWG